MPIYDIKPNGAPMIKEKEFATCINYKDENFLYTFS